jgi:hypothetical protein
MAPAMNALSFEELDEKAIEYDEAVERAFPLDRFCSSSFWILPAVRHLLPAAQPKIFQREGSYVLFAQSSTWLHPLEVMWGLPCPLVGSDPEAAAELLLGVLEKEDRWGAALVTGVLESSPLRSLLIRALGRRFEVGFGPATRRYVARLDAGLEGFLRHRSSGFRRNMDKAERAARRLGVVFELAENDRDVSFERLLAVERRSWKGIRGVSIENEPMQSFYRDMNRRLSSRKQRRLTFARLDGEDVAYILGGVFANTYRGLQFSFDARFRSLSLGNLCQIEEIRRLSEAGIERYDLGSEVRYKKRWGEEVVASTAIVVHR